MVVEYIRYTIGPERAEAFEAAYARAVLPLSRSPYCVDHQLTRCEEEPSAYIMRITWTSTADHLEKFRASEEFREFLAEVRSYVDDIDEMRHYAPVGVEGRGASVPSLYAWAGGDAAFSRLTEEFYRRVPRDEVLAPVFAGMDPHHADHVARWLAEVFGGPATYSGRHGGHRHMAGKHLGRGITEEQRRRWVNLMLDVADDVGLPSDPEFRSAFVAYLEWGTRMALIYSAPGATADLEQPMPVWGWGQMPPYRP